MTDTMLEALRAHAKEPEPIDWESKFGEAQESADFWAGAHHEACDIIHQRNEEIYCLKAENTRIHAEMKQMMEGMANIKSMEPMSLVLEVHESMAIKGLKAKITRLEQRCAELEGEKPKWTHVVYPCVGTADQDGNEFEIVEVKGE